MEGPFQEVTSGNPPTEKEEDVKPEEAEPISTTKEEEEKPVVTEDESSTIPPPTMAPPPPPTPGSEEGGICREGWTRLVGRRCFMIMREEMTFVSYKYIRQFETLMVNCIAIFMSLAGGS